MMVRVRLMNGFTYVGSSAARYGSFVPRRPTQSEHQTLR